MQRVVARRFKQCHGPINGEYNYALAA